MNGLVKNIIKYRTQHFFILIKLTFLDVSGDSPKQCYLCTQRVKPSAEFVISSINIMTSGTLLLVLF